MKKLFTLMFLMCCVALTSQAEVISGTCSDTTDVSWSYDTDAKTLTFVANGTRNFIPNFENESKPWIDYRADIEYIYLSDGLTGIGAYAFHGLTALKEVQLPQSVSWIGQYAFQDCIALYIVGMSNAITEIGSHAFSKCYSLTTLPIPNSAQKIGFRAFQMVPNIAYADDRTTEYGARCVNGYIEDEIVYLDNTKKVMAACSAYKQGALTIDAPVEKINESALSNCYRLTSVTFGESISTVPANALENCNALECITLSANTIHLKMYSLACNNLKEVHCRALVPPTDVSSYSFYGVELKNVTLYVPAGSVEAYKEANVWKKFGTIMADTEGTENVQSDEVQSTKVIKDGQVLILRNGKTYTMQGQEVK
jgi:hypothetical protein